MQTRRRPRALTLTLPSEKQPVLIFNGQKYTLRNFSEEGIGVWVSQPVPFGLAAGSHISGDIEIGNQIHPVKLEIVHQSSRVIGLRIVHKSPELADLFKKLLEPSSYAASLKPHRESGTEDKECGRPRLWYVGDGGAELVVWYSGHQHTVIALQLCWMGKWVYRAQFRPTESGYLSDDLTLPLGSIVSLEKLIQHHDPAEPEFLFEASRFLTSVSPPLPGRLFWQFLEMGEQVFLPLDILKAA